MKKNHNKPLKHEQIASLTDSDQSRKLKNPRAFATEIVLSVYSDVALTTDMNKIIECIHHVFGAHVPEFLMNKKEVIHSCQNRIKNQVPNIEAAMDIIASKQTVNISNLNQIKLSMIRILGDEIILEEGTGEPDGWR